MAEKFFRAEKNLGEWSAEAPRTVKCLLTEPR